MPGVKAWLKWLKWITEKMCSALTHISVMPWECHSSDTESSLTANDNQMHAQSQQFLRSQHINDHLSVHGNLKKGLGEDAFNTHPP